jgi:hypothetical protein
MKNPPTRPAFIMDICIDCRLMLPEGRLTLIRIALPDQG